MQDRTVDLSEGGVFLHTATPRPTGTRIHFKLHLADGRSVLEGMAVVVRCVPNAGEDGKVGMALEFTNMDELSRSRLVQLVERMQHAQQKTGPGETEK